MSSIEKRGKKYRAVISVMRDGIRKKVSKSFKTKKEAINWAITMESDKIQGNNIVASDMIFADYFEFWMETYKKNDVRESSYASYEVMLKAIKELFPDVKLSNLTGYKLQTGIDLYGKTHKVSTTTILTKKIKASLKDALYDGYIKKDCFSRLKPHGIAVDDKINYLSVTEFDKLQDYLYAHKLSLQELAILIALETGMRIGEVLALNHSDISEPFKNIHIEKSKTVMGKITQPKNKSSIRDIKVTHNLIDMILKYSSSQERICGNISRTKLKHTLNKITKELDLTPITVHGLRHSHASYLLYKGVSINYVSSRLGHANISITQQVYAHMLEEEEINETEKTIKLLSDKYNQNKKELQL